MHACDVGTVANSEREESQGAWGAAALVQTATERAKVFAFVETEQTDEAVAVVVVVVVYVCVCIGASGRV